MRILANENFPGDAVEALRQQGHDVAWVRVDALGSDDGTVLQRAQNVFSSPLTKISAN
jgi:hypothetical protein